MEKLTHWFLEITKVLHLPLIIGGYLNLKCRGERKNKKPYSMKIWGDNIPHFIFSR